MTTTFFHAAASGYDRKPNRAVHTPFRKLQNLHTLKNNINNSTTHFKSNKLICKYLPQNKHVDKNELSAYSQVHLRAISTTDLGFAPVPDVECRTTIRRKSILIHPTENALTKQHQIQRMKKRSKWKSKRKRQINPARTIKSTPQLGNSANANVDGRRATTLRKKENNASKALRGLKASGATNEKQDEPCGEFRADTTASSFGLCKCGHKQADHKEKVVNPARDALKSLKIKNSTKSIVTREKGKVCTDFKIDPAAAEFGTCLCGFKKADHEAREENAAAGMLRKLKERNQSIRAQETQLAAPLPQDEASDDQDDEESQHETEKLVGEADASFEQVAAPQPKACCIIM
mmetsp:Transcript_5308/g.9433  ORF Transcript_5308/g.9433 Transcript_5308/m.9433 type:complete len:348 (+) Transcript_5308:152-1195(+)